MKDLPYNELWKIGPSPSRDAISIRRVDDEECVILVLRALGDTSGESGLIAEHIVNLHNQYIKEKNHA